MIGIMITLILMRIFSMLQRVERTLDRVDRVMETVDKVNSIVNYASDFPLQMLQKIVERFIK